MTAGGAWVGLGVIASSVPLGLAWRHGYRHVPPHVRIRALVSSGLAVHVVAACWFHFLPIDFDQTVPHRIAPPYVAMPTVTSLAMGVPSREIEENRQFDRILDESEERHGSPFSSATIAILEIDPTRIYRRLEAIRDQGVDDPRNHPTANRDIVEEPIASIRVVGVNSGAPMLFGVASERAFRRGIDRFFGAEARDTFIDGMRAPWTKQDTFTAETVHRAKDGRPIPRVHSMPAPKTAATARQVPVSIVDISIQKESARQPTEERRLPQEIPWGANVGTWEWNVRTGDVNFNERRAEIAGFSLAELAPVSIQSWIDLARPEDLAESDRALKEVLDRKAEYHEREARPRHKNGHWAWVQDRGKIVEWTEDGKPPRMSGTHSDITERKTAETHAQRPSMVRDTILKCHAVILREQDETRLFQRVAEIPIKARGYALVWIGPPIPDDENRVKLVARAGDAAGHVDLLDIRREDDEGAAMRPSVMAVRTGRVQVAHDLTSLLKGKRWAEEAERRGFKSHLVAPIRHSQETAAPLHVHGSIEEALDDVEIDLITEFSNNIGLALRSLRLSREAISPHSALEDAALGAVRAIAAAIEKRDPYTSGHQENVATISVAIAKAMDQPADRIDGLRPGAIIHDIGKIYIPAEILNRPGRLAESEFGMIKSHPRVGCEILENTTFPWPIKEMVAQRHERIGGAGYPKGPKGGDIIDEAKIIAVADVLDAITSRRPYRPGKGIDVALAEIERGRGAACDPDVADTRIGLIRDEGFPWGDIRTTPEVAAQG